MSDVGRIMNSVDIFPVIEPAELKTADQVRWRLALIRWFDDSFTKLAAHRPTPKSQLAADDRATGWLQESHQVKGYLTMAADNLRALLAMLLTGNNLEIPLQAHYPLIRAALEAAAEVKWILSPHDQAERVRRSLAARMTDLREDGKLYEVEKRAVLLYLPELAEVIGSAGALESERAEKTEVEARRIAKELDIAWGTIASGAPGMASIIRQVGPGGGVPGEYAVAVWKVLSGLSHPSASRAVRNAHVEQLSESDGGVISARITASLDHTHQGLLVAQALFTDAVELYRLRMIAPHVPR